MFRVVLDGIEISDPEGLDGLETVIEYEDKTGFITCKTTNTLTFFGGGYEIIKNKINSDGYCTRLPIRIYQDCSDGNFELIVEGVIILTDAVIEPCKCMAKVKIVDNNITSYIENNQEIKIDPNSNRTKSSDEDNLTPLTSKTISMIMTGSGVNAGDNQRDVEFYELNDWISHTISFISDNNLGFKSDFLSSLPYCIGITSPSNIRGEDRDSFFCFLDVYDFLRKRYNLVLFHDGGNICIEQLSTIEEAPVNLTVECISDLEVSVDTSRLFGRVRAGNNNEEGGQELNVNLPNASCIQHRRETFTVGTDCNTRSSLDLTYDAITSHNTISAIFFGSDEFDELPVILQYDCDSCEPIYDDPFDTFMPDRGFVLNPAFYNCEMLQEYCFIGDVYKNNLAPINPNFLATESNNLFPAKLFTAPSQSSSNDQLQFSNDSNDPSNSYGNGTPQGNPVSLDDSKYIVPQDGLYTFDVSLNGAISFASLPQPQFSQIITGTAGSYVNQFWPYDDGTGKTVYDVRIRIKLSINGSQQFPMFDQSAFPSSSTPGFLPSSCYNQIATTDAFGGINYPNGEPIYEAPVASCNFTINASSLPMQLNAGDCIEVFGCYDDYPTFVGNTALNTLGHSIQFFNQSFGTSGVVTGEQGILVPATEDKNLTELDFERCLSQAEIREILNNKYDAINVSSDCLPRDAKSFIERLTINHQTKDVSFKLRTNLDRL